MPNDGRAFYERQIAYLEAMDVDALMAQYHPEAVLITFDQTIQGHEALRTYLTAYLVRLGSFRLLSTDRFAETEDAIFFEATILTSHAQARIYDVFMLRDGRTTHQFAGILELRPHDPPQSVTSKGG